ncbi:MAG: winged helix-turn-helix transcriptional regulator [Proteobacteria bacterium]|nr:winged helix-turn-helix transcriptional regulator [Pseudomonadota bacterium]
MSARPETLFDGANALSVRKEIFADELTARTPANESALVLTHFTPFRLNRLAEGVSNHLAEVYKQKFGLEIPEWRVIATVGPMWSCTAQHIADTTRMHKTRVSRAIANLVKRELIERTSNADDRREMELRLTKSGRAMYTELVPLALERERALLACLGQEELRAFNGALDRFEEFLGLA